MALSVHVIKCATDPTQAPTEVGQHWINTTNGCMFLSIGTATVADWIKIQDVVKVSSNDTTAGFLFEKLVAGNGITLVEINDGGNETLQINASGSAFTDEKVKVSSNDTTEKFLFDAVISSDNSVTISEDNDGGDESLDLVINTSVTDQNLFETISTPAGTNPVADGPTDTLAFLSSDNSVIITGDSAADSIDFQVDTSVTNQNLFETISVPLGTNPVADSPTDTLGFASADNSVEITGNAGGDSVNFKVTIGLDDIEDVNCPAPNDEDILIFDTGTGKFICASVSTIALDEKVKVSANDTTPDFLFPKLQGGTGITITEQNDGSNESILIEASGSSFTDEQVKVSSADTTPGFLNDELTVDTGSNASDALEKTIANPTADEKLNIRLDESKIIHQNLSGAGTNTHAQIDAHLASILNPHAVTFTQAIAADSGTDMTAAEAETLTDGSNADLLHEHAASSDELVKVSSNDTTPGFLLDKLITSDESNSTNILELKEVNDGGDEDLKLAFDETKIDHANIQNIGINTHAQIDNHIASTANPHSTTFTQAVAADAGTDITAAEAETLTNGSNADLLHDHAPSPDELVKISANDTTGGFLNGKLVAGTGITLAELNDGGNETFEINSTITPGAILVALFASSANNVNNKFLSSESVATSDNLPAVVPVAETLTKVSFTNVNNAPTGTIEIRVNTTVGPPAVSLNITTLTRTEVFNISLAVSANDELNCFLSTAFGVGKPLVKVYA